MFHPYILAEFDSLLNYLYNLQRLGIKVGLDHTFELLKRCGNPQNDFKSIHVAGTNGKGSTCAVISSILEAAGLKVGLYTSPHLIRFNERIRVNGEPIDDTEIVRFIESYRKDIDEIESTFFETTTAMAFQHFANKTVDVAVIETGLGGRLDSTNVLQPSMTVITPISLDHREILGNDIISIAKEKGGIIKNDIPLIMAPQPRHVRGELLNMARKSNSPVMEVGFPSYFQLSECETEFEYGENPYKIPLIGHHQSLNASIGIEATQGFIPEIGKEIIDTGLMQTKWPGRLQRMSKNYPIYYDVAHNAHGLISIFETIGSVFTQKPIGLFVMKGDKEIDLVIPVLANQFEKLIISGASELGLMSAQKLSEKLSNHGLTDFDVIDSFCDALDRIVELSHKTGRPTLILGSHYIAKEVFNKFGFLF
ncbi:MAG: bifunctional folylpolyglutamate synthase/dihydrofolate synthase [Candidatus Marinimicrobia bacterium]|nr:bifunctional folylpolyglutamate synthase/dihydrofolate synthase [Candidatus Neomarinimicrobiota bacterium]MBT4810174.1 bifunctional folylpolyglutamate synthase/dihydrofolate synthase [Candidatus Neomarinimicrobiota bacterium]